MASYRIRERLQSLIIYFRDTSHWRTSTLTSVLLGLALFGVWHAGRLKIQPIPDRKEDGSEPGLFKKHSAVRKFTIPSGYTYPGIRVFYHEHPQAAKLPKGLPLLVFMHGLGGNATQFAPLLTSLVNVAPCLAIDLPGCGRSLFEPDDVGAYTIEAFAELLYTVINQYRDTENNQQVVLIGHSMGCAITLLLASSTSPLRQRLDANYIIGMIAICPRATPPPIPDQRLKWLPAPVFDLFRMWDRRGGLDSASVTRVVGYGADEETRKLQIKYNRQSYSAVFLRIVLVAFPLWPEGKVWAGVRTPLFLIAGESDHLTSPEEVERIAALLSIEDDATRPQSRDVVASTADHHPPQKITQPCADVQASETAPKAGGAPQSLPTTAGDAEIAERDISERGIATATTNSPTTGGSIKDGNQTTKHSFALKTSVFPAPAAHGLMYATSTVRVLSGLIESFLSHHVDERLTLGWQLQHLTTSGKWDVKNLKKWQSIDRCSVPIAGVFRAMKTMREVDDTHQPKEFVKRFGSRVLPNGVAMVVDISHESPVYDPKGLENGGVEYHKFPTVSKLPPTADEVEQFISLIDQLRQSDKFHPKDGEAVVPTIAVHCHYGFNRTGFFIVCYLVERLQYELQDAIDEFKQKREPGIKHQHFLNELFVRYAVQMQRRGTIVG